MLAPPTWVPASAVRMYLVSPSRLRGRDCETTVTVTSELRAVRLSRKEVADRFSLPLPALGLTPLIASARTCSAV